MVQPESATRSARRQRWFFFAILITSSAAIMTGRLLNVAALSYGREVPFLSANDRSRWCTIRSLGDDDTYCIDLLLQDPQDGRVWDSIDKVVHPGRDGQPHSYSSKPTLLPTLLAYEYLAIKQLTGKTLRDDTFFVVRLMLFLSQVLPMVLLFCMVGVMANEVALTDWGRLFVVATAAFGTYLTTFAITLNNHLPAAVSTSIALVALLLIWRGGRRHWSLFVIAGLFSALAAANELPAVSLVAVAGGLCLLQSPLRTLLGFTPPVLLVAAALLGTNWQAHGQLKPPYAQRSDGAVAASLAGEFQSQLDRGELPAEIVQAAVASQPDLDGSKLTEVQAGRWPLPEGVLRRWIVVDEHGFGWLAIVQTQSQAIQLRRWENWYEYPGSYWFAPERVMSRVDQGESSGQTYALHFLIGHHGLFSLSPVWLLSVPGMLVICISGRYRLRLLGLSILLISLAVIAFYLTRPPLDRNYGGVSSGLRWLFWLAPLWLLAMIPVLDWMSNKPLLKWLAILLLGVSVFSAFYASSNPWSHPWIYQWLYPVQ